VAELPFIDAAAQIQDNGTILLSSKEDKANKGTANGYAPLDANAKVPVANLPDQASLDAEVAAAVSAHNALTNPHGISNTANLVYTNDSRLSDSRNPTAHSHPISDVTNLQNALDGKQPSGNYAPASGISPSAITGTAVVTSDPRLSDARTPTAHSHAISDVTNLQSALDGKQASGTYATLVGGKVPSDQLPSFVDDVLEYANNSAFPATGEAGKIYVSLATNKTFRWSGSAYIEISPSEVTSINTKTGAVTLTASDVGACASNDARLSDKRTPTAHKSSHATGGADALTPADIGASATSHTHAISDVTNLQNTLDGKQASGSYAPATGISPSAITGTAVITTDSRLSNSRTPTAHKSTHATGGTDALTPSDIGASPTGHAHSISDITDLSYRLLREAPFTGGSNIRAGDALYGLNPVLAGSGNTVLGVDAKTRGGSNCVAIGYYALRENDGNNNTAVGCETAYSNSPSGDNNTAVGYRAHARGSGSGNVAVGVSTMQSCQNNNNVGVGSNALAFLNTGAGNTAVGAYSLSTNANGSNNVAVGIRALRDNTVDNNSALGTEALAKNSTGTDNTALGFQALTNNTLAGVNTAVGAFAIYSNNGTNGANTGVGAYCLFNSTGAHNTGIGYQAGQSIVTGSGNTVVGSEANVDSGSRGLCLVLGRGAVSPAVDGSLAIGGSGGNAMNGLTTTTAPTGATGTYLRIWLNGLEYRMPIQRAS